MRSRRTGRVRTALLALVLAPLVFAVALALSFPVAVKVAEAGLSADGPTLPLTFGIAAAFAAFGAAWFSNLLARGVSRARLGAVLLWTEATAFVILTLLPVMQSLGQVVSLTLFVELLVGTVPVALNATIFSMCLREPGTSRRRDVVLGLAVAVAASAAPLLVLSEACPYIGCTG